LAGAFCLIAFGLTIERPGSFGLWAETSRPLSRGLSAHTLAVLRLYGADLQEGSSSMTNDQPSNSDFTLIAGIFTVFLCVLFGSNAVAIKLALNGLGTFTTAGLRFALASLVIFVWAKISGHPLRLKKGQLPQMLTISLLFWIQISMFYFGLSQSNASRGTLLANMLPFHILFLAHFFIPGDRITKRKLFGILLGFGGVVSMFMEKEGLAGNFRLGDMIILVATFFWACSVVYIKNIIHAYNPFQIVMYSMVFAVPLFFVEALLWDNAMIIQLDAKIIAALLYQSIITASFGFVAWNHLLQKYGAVSLHSFIFIMPIAGVALGGLILNEPITTKILLALVLIVCGILVVHLKPRKTAPAYPIRRHI
jgi:drug/metabolite transporter (DMT)-like permease